VRVGPEGLPAGELGERAGLPPASRNFHLSRLEAAGLVGKRRDGRKVVYAADYSRVQELAAFLVDECCVDATTPCC